MKHKTTLKFLGSCLAISLLSGCQQGDKGPAWDQGPAQLPIAVVEQGNVKSTKEYAASIEGVANVEIRPQVSGYLEKILVDEGEYVKAGQVLFQIENSVYSQQYNNAMANLTAMQIDLDKKKELVKSKIVSGLQVDQALAALKAAQALAESAKINLGFCTIKAPVSGYVSRIPYRLGSLVAPANTDPLTFLSDIHEVNVYFSLSEHDFVAFQKQYGIGPGGNGLSALPQVTLLTTDGEPYKFKGRIDAVDGRFDKNTGSITLRARFKNPETLLRSGNTGKIVLEQNYDRAIILPVASTMTIQDKIFVFSLDKDSKAIQLPIEVAGKSGNQYIVASGLKPGDKYIVTGFDRLQAGTPVVCQKKDTPIQNQ